MFKLVVLSVCVALVAAAPSVHHSPDQYSYAGPVASYAAAGPVLLQEYQHIPAVAKVAEVVEHVPSSVSHHSSAVVHSSAAVATPVITPVAKTIVASAPIVHAAPIRTIEAAPIVEEIREAEIVDTYHAAPVLSEVAAPAAYAKIAEVVEHVPSSVSHHSSSIVHSTAPVATPVITPVAKTVLRTAPVYQAPVFKAAPIVHAGPIVEAAPVFKEVHGVAHDVVEIQPAYAKVAEVVEHVPSSVSHHSSSIVHNTAAVATPVITPVAKTVVHTAPVYKAPVLKTVHAPASYAIHEAPLYNNLPYAAYNHGPIHEAPLYNSLPYAAYNRGPAYYSEPLLRSW